jgi:adenosine deaminase
MSDGVKRRLFLGYSALALGGGVPLAQSLRGGAEGTSSETAKVINRGYFIHGLPKAELHIHLEGLLEPADVLQLNAKRGLDYPYRTVDDVVDRLAQITDLPTFIEVYESHARVLVEPEDFYELAFRYFVRSQQQGVRRVELHFDPQLHLPRGISLEAIVRALDRAAKDARERLDLSAGYIMAFNRNRSAESAMEILEASEPLSEMILGVGLDNPEEPGFPQKFAAVFRRARSMGYRLTSHCDVDQPDSHVHLRDCIELLGVDRIDHGVNIIDKPELIERARSAGIGFTVCPNIFAAPGGYYLGYFKTCAQAIARMRAEGLPVMINTDDPGLMASTYLNDVYHGMADQNGWSVRDLVELARQSFQLAWITEEERGRHLARLDQYVAGW